MPPTVFATALGSTVAENSIRFLGHDAHEHEDPHLVYVVSGAATLTVDGVDHPMRRHESAWLQPRVLHAVRIEPGGMVLGPMLEPEASPPERLRMLGVVPTIVEVMTTALVAAPGASEEVQPFRRALGRALARLSRQFFPVSLPEHPAARSIAQRAVRSHESLDQLAARHRMSARQVQRVFTAETGLPFSRWRTRARLNAAVSCIAGGGDLAAAARRAGFASRAGLLKALGRESGVPVDELARDPRAALDLA